jgi:hypothetical protein
VNPDPFTECQSCGHNWMLHGPDGCLHHEGGYICECRISNDDQPRRSGWIKCDPSVPKLLAEAHARADRLDAENNERFARETEYQNRIRELEAKVRTLEQTLADIGYYIQRRVS